MTKILVIPADPNQPIRYEEAEFEQFPEILGGDCSRHCRWSRAGDMRLTMTSLCETTDSMGVLTHLDPDGNPLPYNRRAHALMKLIGGEDSFVPFGDVIVDGGTADNEDPLYASNPFMEDLPEGFKEFLQGIVFWVDVDIQGPGADYVRYAFESDTFWDVAIAATNPQKCSIIDYNRVFPPVFSAVNHGVLDITGAIVKETFWRPKGL